MALVGLEVVKAWYGYSVVGLPWPELLPLDLCRISSFVCCAMLMLRSYPIFEVAYFWGIGGSVAAMLTPDLQAGFPAFEFMGFFAGHGLVLASVMYAVSAFGFAPRLKSIALAAVVSGAYMGLIAVVNILLGTNYLFLCHKPEITTIYDFLGPWPWYIASVWVIGVVVAYLLYLPFSKRPLPRER